MRMPLIVLLNLLSCTITSYTCALFRVVEYTGTAVVRFCVLDCYLHCLSAISVNKQSVRFTFNYYIFNATYVVWSKLNQKFMKSKQNSSLLFNLVYNINYVSLTVNLLYKVFL